MCVSFIHRQRRTVFKAFLHNMWPPPAQLCYPRRQENMTNFQHGRNNSKSNSLCNSQTRVTRTILPSLANKHFGKQGHLPSPKQYTRNLAVTIAWGCGEFLWVSRQPAGSVTNVMALLKRDGGYDVMHAVLNFIAWERSGCFSDYINQPTRLHNEVYV